MVDWLSHRHPGILWSRHIPQTPGQCTAHESTKVHLLQVLSKVTGISQQRQSMQQQQKPHSHPKSGPFLQEGAALFAIFLLHWFNATALTAKTVGNVFKSQRRDLHCCVKDQPWLQKLGGPGRLTCQMRLATAQAFQPIPDLQRQGLPPKELQGCLSK